MFGTSSNLIITANDIVRCNHGITIGTAASNPRMFNVTIASNVIDWLSVWDGHPDNHLDGIIIFNEAPAFDGILSNCSIYANTIGPRVGTVNTAGIFVDNYDFRQVVGMSIYNNIFSETPPHTWSNGRVRIFACTNSLVVNNTFTTIGGRSGTGIMLGNASVNGAASLKILKV